MPSPPLLTPCPLPPRRAVSPTKVAPACRPPHPPPQELPSPDPASTIAHLACHPPPPSRSPLTPLLPPPPRHLPIAHPPTRGRSHPASASPCSVAVCTPPHPPPPSTRRCHLSLPRSLPPPGLLPPTLTPAPRPWQHPPSSVPSALSPPAPPPPPHARSALPYTCSTTSPLHTAHPEASPCFPPPAAPRPMTTHTPLES